jgi:hypothetical protein
VEVLCVTSKLITELAASSVITTEVSEDSKIIQSFAAVSSLQYERNFTSVIELEGIE